jgi:Fic family protein
MVRQGDPYGTRAQRRDAPYRAYVPDAIAHLDYVPSRATFASLTAAAEQSARLDARAEGSPARISRLLGLLCRSEGVGSSTIEGYRAPMAKIVVASATGDEPHNLTTSTIIRDGIHAVETALNSLGRHDDPLTPSAIEDVQRDLMHNHGEHLKGYRTDHVQIGGDLTDPNTADFVPPPATSVPTLMQDLCDFANKTDSDLHPIARAAIAHAQFETIHPFPDGNGRTGRTLIQAMLRREGVTEHAILPISLAIARTPATMDAYVESLNAMRGEEHDPADLDGLVGTFSTFVSDAAGRAMRMIDRADAAYEQMTQMVTENIRSDSCAPTLVDLIASRVGLTVTAAAEETGLDHQAVRNALTRMSELGIVDSRSGGRYGRVYFAPALVTLIEEETGAPLVEADEPPSSATRLPGGASTIAVGPGRGRPRNGDRCTKPLRTGGNCMRVRGHTGGCRHTP